MAEIALRHGIVLLDDEDLPLVQAISFWAVSRGSRTSYAAHTRKGRPTILMHRLLMSPAPDKVVDHIDGNGLNNRRSNLRVCSQAENVRWQAPKLDKLKGVFSNTDGKTWQAKIGFEWRLIHIGTFKTQEEVARAYDSAALELFGEFARVNFPKKVG